METNIAAGSAQAGIVIGAALFAQSQKETGMMKNLRGSIPNSTAAEDKLEGKKTSPGMPVVDFFDLAKTAGDRVTIDCVNVSTMKPIMGDRDSERKGVAMSHSSMEVKLNQWTFPVSAGGAMSQQRTKHKLRNQARATAVGLAGRYFEQRTLVHMAGARGVNAGADWVVPLSSDADFTEIMTSPVLAPTYNRHYVVSGTNLVQGGANLATISAADLLTLNHIDALANILDNLDLTLQQVKIMDDPAAMDEPMRIMLCPSNVYSQLLVSGQLRAFQQNAITRASYGSKHPLFRGDVGMWNGILVKKMQRSIAFLPGTVVKHVSAANALTATETDVTVNGGLTAGFGVERCLLLGAQAVANAYGQVSGSGTHYVWRENAYNFGDNPEYAVRGIDGSAKVRFTYPNASGQQVPTDHGVIAIDVASRTSVIN